MAYQPPPPSREYNQKRVVDIVRIGHDTLDKEHKKLQEAVKGIYNFQAIPNNPSTGKIYQYELENQHLFDEFEVLISSVLGVFEPVVNESKKNLFSLEMGIPQGTEYDMPPQPTPKDTGQDYIKDSRSFMDKLKGVQKQKRIIMPHDPYEHGIEFLTKTMEKMDTFELFVEYQAFGVDLMTGAFPASSYGMMYYLTFHRNRFKHFIAPTILRVHRQYIEMIKKREKEGAIKMAKGMDEELYASRNDFQQPS